jgi:V/A-type H+-transporting ATPase subunit E
MSLDKLTNTIIESAENKAQEIREKYNQEIQKIKATTEEQIKQLTQENNEKIEREQNLIRTQLISNAELNSQQSLLKTKWTLIDEVFKKAQDKFTASDAYLNSLKDIILKNSDNNSEIIIAKRDYDKLQKLLPNIKLTSSDNLLNGLIIKKGRIELNYSLDRIISSLKNELVIELSRMLFEQNK